MGAAIAVLLTALVAALALSGVSDAAARLSFGDAPTGWSVTSGESDDKVGKVTASGVKQKRIRYALSGASGFSIKSKSGVVSYDGSAIDAEQAQLNVTARDSKGKAESASVVITVSVAHDAPGATVALDDPGAGGDDPALGAVIAARAVAGVADALAQAAAAAQTPANNEPRFADDVAIRIVAENSPAGALVGAPLTASDLDNDGLTYSLSGSDAFRIGASSGQIAVAEGAVLDYETQPAYTLTVGVSDGKNASGESDPSVDDTVEVVVNLTDVDETPAEPQLQEREPEVRSEPHTGNEGEGIPTHLAPSHFKATPGDKQVRLSWTNPNNRYSTITKYQYSCSGGSGDDAPCTKSSKWKDIPSGPHATGYRVDGLKNDTEYTFKIRTVPASSVDDWTLVATPTGFKIVHSKLVRRYYRSGEDEYGRRAGYYTTLEPVGSNHQPRLVNEGHSVSGRDRGVAFLESNDKRVKWTIDSVSEDYGFNLGRMRGSSYTSYAKPTGTMQEKMKLYHDRGSWVSTQFMAVHYDGTKWSQLANPPGSTHDIEVTGTDHMGRQITVTIEVGLISSE